MDPNLRKQILLNMMQVSASRDQEFEAGDAIVNKRTGETAVVIGVPGMARYDKVGYMGASDGIQILRDGGGEHWDFAKEWEVVARTTVPKTQPQKKPSKVDIVKLESLVLDDAAKNEIIAVLKQHQNYDKLFTTWGLGDTIEYGRGMTFMFYGPPGTGKTWGANCIAKALDKELLVLSAAEIQSSEPGAANRAIKQAFATAKSQGKVLFIDECDSLITNRADLGMILASEVNTLLTEIEKFEGVAILATNRIETMDEALERRISLIVEFPFPNQKQREAIWGKLLPKKLPLDEAVTIEDLSKVELSGGQIKNVILQAARIALGAESEKVKPEHFKAAIARIKKSKNLMGSASRYRQTRVQDYGVGTGVNTDVGKFLDEDIETDIDTDIIKGETK